MAPKRTDRYWTRIKLIIVANLITFLLYVIAYIIQIPADIEDPGLSTYPLVNAFVSVLAFTFLSGILLFWHSLYRDKQELAKDFDDVEQRHWITIGVFSYFTVGLYPLWYLYARYRRTKDEVADENSVFGALSGIVSKASAPFAQLFTSEQFQNGDSYGPQQGRLGRLGTTVNSIYEKSIGQNDTTPRPSEIHQSAQQVIQKAGNTRERGEYAKAISKYEDAIDDYERAKRQANNDELVATIDSELAEVETKLEETRDKLAQFDSICDPLQDAESSLQTAVAQHAQDEVVPARRDYRQARDHYEQALSALDKVEEDLFDAYGETTVPVNVEVDYLTGNLSAWPHLTENQQETLSNAGIGTLSDLKSAGDKTITTLEEDGDIDKELANRLRAAIWWHGDEERTFTSRQTIKRQCDRAEQGRQMLR